MKRTTVFSLGLCLLFAGLSTLAAQEQTMSPPKVLVIAREFLKPGRSGAVHAKSESAFVNAFVAAKWPTNYLGMDSLSGQSRSLFMVGYDSFAAWEKDNQATQNNATLAAALDRAAMADGDLLSSYDSSVAVYRDDLSLRAGVDIGQMRYMEISRIQIRAGHEKDWDALVKMYVNGYQKAVPDGRWATFQSAYGTDNGGVYLIITPMKSAAEIDSSFGQSKQFEAAMGEDGMKKLAELAAMCIESSQTNLFQFNPKISYPAERWIKSDPAFWKPTQ